jgi:CHAT domain-containing protein
MLVELKLKQQDITGALELWEWYRAAPRRVPSSSSGGAVPAELSPTALDAGPDLPPLTAVTRRESELTTQTVVSYAVLPGGLAVWVYDNRGVRGRWIPLAPEELRRRLERFTKLCADPRSDITILRQEASRLYSILISGVADWLPPDRRLLVEPDIDIESVPLEALIDPGGRYLIESYALTSWPGLYDADSLRNDDDFSINKHVLVVGSAAGAPDGETSLAPLPDALNEAQTVARNFPSSRLLLGKDATLANIRRGLPDVQIFHFAGHAMTRSAHVGMLLTDDQNRGGSTVLLDAATLGTMKLDHLQLAVLSACATDSGTDGSPVDPDSLVRAFLRFGVPHVVASRWNVDSKATAATIVGFYRALLSGKSVAESLRVGAELVRERPETAHPYYWAAFSAFGRT